MVFQIIQKSVWFNIFGFTSIAIITAIVFLLISAKLTRKLTVWILVAGVVLVPAITVGSLVGNHQRDAQNNTNFSQQLMDEYDATSSRSIHQMELDFKQFNEASTVFTKNGKDTPVFVKRVSDDGKKITMIFTVADAKALYPKPSK